MLTLDVHEEAIFCHYRPDDADPYDGGCMGRCWPGGTFCDWTFDRLYALGTGDHDVLVDEKVESVDSGKRPFFEADFDRAWAMFVYARGDVNRARLKKAAEARSVG